jgi:hypothetical protein
LNAAELANTPTALAAVGLPLPEIITLHRGLVGRGLLPAGPLPRCAADLLALLSGANTAPASL